MASPSSISLENCTHHYTFCIVTGLTDSASLCQIHDHASNDTVLILASTAQVSGMSLFDAVDFEIVCIGLVSCTEAIARDSVIPCSRTERISQRLRPDE